MNPFLQKLMSRLYRAPAGDDDGGAGGTDDHAAAVARGDIIEEPATGTDALSDDEKAAAEAAVADLAKKGEKTPDEAEVDEEKEAAAKEEKKKDIRIPLNRHKELLEKERDRAAALEAENAKLRAGQQTLVSNEEIAATETKIEGLETEHASLLADGKLKEAAAKMKEIRLLERGIADQKADIKAAEAEARAVDRMQFDAAVDKIEAAYPAMDPKSEDFDKDGVAEVLVLKNALQAQGYSATVALQKAVKYVLGEATKAQTKAIEEEKPAKNVKAETESARKAAAVAKGIDASKRTPANAADIGLNSDKLGGGFTPENIMKLSQADFAKLDEKTLAKARGDML